MFRSIILATTALALAACSSTVPPASPGQVPVDQAPVVVTPAPVTGPSLAETTARAKAALDRAWTAYLTIRRVAGMVEPLLSPVRRANLQSLEGAIEGYFLKARLASTFADQAVQLELAVRAASQLDAIVTDPD